MQLVGKFRNSCVQCRCRSQDTARKRLGRLCGTPICQGLGCLGRGGRRALLGRVGVRQRAAGQELAIGLDLGLLSTVAAVLVILVPDCSFLDMSIDP